MIYHENSGNKKITKGRGSERLYRARGFNEPSKDEKNSVKLSMASR